MSEKVAQESVDEITQESVDEVVAEAREYWAGLVKDSGKTQTEFIASRGIATETLYTFALFKSQAIEEGLTCPDIVEGVTIKLFDQEDN